MPIEMAYELIPTIKNLGATTICLHGHGETTTYKGWEEFAALLIDEGFKLVMCSNLKKTFSAAEIDTLARFNSLTVSIDSLDPEIFASIRRGCKLQQVLQNIDSIQMAARTIQNKLQWSLDIVPTDRNIDGILDVIKLAHSIGFRSVILSNLDNAVSTQIGIDLKHPSEIPQARQVFEECKQFCDQNKMIIVFQGALSELL